MVLPGAWFGTSWSAGGVLRLVSWTAAFVVAGYVGRATIIDGGSLSLVWPAAGIAALFLATAGRAWAPVLICLVVATFVVNRTTGASNALAVVFVITNLSQVVLFVAVLKRWLPHVWGFGGDEPLRRFVDLGRLTVAATASGLIGAGLGSLGLVLVTGATMWPDFVVWWGRNAVGIIVIATLGLLVGPELARVRSLRDLVVLGRRSVVPRNRGHAVEAVMLVVLSAVLYGAIFFLAGVQPLSFMLLVPALWAGIRFRPPGVATYGIAAGAAAVWLTLGGYGPFAGIDRIDLRAVVVQVFVAMAVLTGLALAFSRGERERAMADLAVARQGEAERAQLLGAVLESMTEGVVVLGQHDHVLVHNPAGEEMFGPAVELTYLDGSVVPAERMPAMRAFGGETIAGEDYVLRREDPPSSQVVEVAARPLPGGAGDHPRAIVVARDVTVDRDHRQGLSRFAGVVAHDLQNPLTVVEGWTESLQEEFEGGAVEPGTALPMLDRVARAAAHMRTFIGDLLSYTLTRDQTLHLGELDVGALAQHVARLYEDRSSRPVFTVSEIPTVWADRRLVRQLLDNLLGNAVKYVAAGVRPHVVVTGRVHQPDWLEVRVADNGIGIPEADRERVFEALQRVQGHGGYQGTGLGLAICRQVVERHGGEICAEAAPEGGTVFVFTLPRSAAAYAQARGLG